MRKPPQKKRAARSMRPRNNVHPTRMALAALERITTVLERSGHAERLKAPVDAGELEARGAFVGVALPPSYVATMQMHGQIGEPETFLSARSMWLEAGRIARFGGEAAKRYAPFARDAEHILCFDKETGRSDAMRTGTDDLELPIVAWHDGTANPIAAHFGEWLDSVADAREEALENAGKIPPRLKQLLDELGFRFDTPVIGRLETGDIAAITLLLGPEVAKRVRGDVDRLFDASGKAALSLNVDEFSITATLRTGVHVFEAEDVFRWLRTFRDENFFAEKPTPPARGDRVRDLRKAPREALLIQRSVLRLRALPAKSLTFRSASGKSADDFHLLARAGERGPSTILHVVGREVATAHKVDAALCDVHVTDHGTIWGLTATHAVRIGSGRSHAFPLPAPTAGGQPSWHGIGGAGDHVLVWGAGSLLTFDGRAFVPFSPEPMLDHDESVIALHLFGDEIWMLVISDQLGSVARFDSQEWVPIPEHHVIGTQLSAFDVWRGVAYVIDRDGGTWKFDGGPPQPVNLLADHQAYQTEAEGPRFIHGVRGWSGGLLLASTGGVIAAGEAEPLFHAVPNGNDPVRLVRLDGRTTTSPADDEAVTAIALLSGGGAWIWDDGEFSPIDVRDW